MEQIGNEHTGFTNFQSEKAAFVRIKSLYNCEEQRVVTLSAPFRGFSCMVRFQCRAMLHNIETVNLNTSMEPDLVTAKSEMEQM